MWGCAKPDFSVEELLFPQPDSTALVLNFNDLGKDGDSLMNAICKHNYQVYVNTDKYHLKFDYYAWGYECEPVFSCILPLSGRQRIDVLINEREQILFEHEVIKRNELDSMFKLGYLNPLEDQRFLHNPRSSIVQVKWDVKTDSTFVKDVLNTLAESYSAIIKNKLLLESEISKQHQVDSLTQAFPFRLSLPVPHGVYQKVVAPPPPPPRRLD